MKPQNWPLHEKKAILEIHLSLPSHPMYVSKVTSPFLPHNLVVFLKSITPILCACKTQTEISQWLLSLPAKISLLHWLSIMWQSPSSLLGALVSSLLTKPPKGAVWQTGSHNFFHPFWESRIKFRGITRIYPVRPRVAGISTITESLSEMFTQLPTWCGWTSMAQDSVEHVGRWHLTQSSHSFV